MAKRSQDLAAAKAKKQKIILIVGGVLLLAVGAFQGPKLLKHGGTAAPDASASSSGTGAALTPVAVGGVAVAPKGSAMVAGVALPRATVVKVAPTQLASFTLFKVKDPFVQRVGATLTPAQAASDAFYNQNGKAPTAAGLSGGPSAGTSGGTSGSTAGSTSTPTSPTQAAPPPPVVYATIDFDGKAQQVQAKDKFPADAPLFFVRSVKKNQVKIGVAGGSFDDSQAVVLKEGKTVTLVNTATGVRYELKLVYTGAQPEVIKGFTTTSPTAPADALAGTTPTTTTAK